MIGVKRNIFEKAQNLLGKFPIIAIVGARQVGKTTLAKNLCPGWKYVDLENPDDYTRISDNPTFFFEQYPERLIIDEAQVWPDIFKVLRGVVDNNRTMKNRFIITGSSSLDLISQISETLAGRIAVIDLSPLKANEFYQTPLSPFYDLFTDKLHSSRLVTGEAPLTNQQMQKIWLQGGYPEPLLSQDPIFYQHWMSNYRDTYINRDVAALFPKLNKQRYQRFIMMLSKLSGTILNKRDLGRAIETSETTVRDYVSIAEGTFLWRSLFSFEKNVTKSIIKMPKGYIRDSGILNFMLKVHSFDDLMENPVVGSSFESFAIEELLRGLESLMISNWQSYYYRTRNGAEIDLVLDGHFGLLPIEIKYGLSTRLKDLAALSSFVEEHNLPFGLVINRARSVEWLSPKIVQIPVGWL